MKRIIQLLAVASLSLGFASCDKNEDLNNGGQVPKLNEVQRFELNSSLGEVGLEALSSNTDKAPAEGFRATLHFKGLTNAAQTTLNAQKYGLGKREARWGVIYDGGKCLSVNCDESVSVAPPVPSNLTKSTVYFKASATPNTIENASIKMYCQTLTPLTNITEGFMVLEGTGSTKGRYHSFIGATNPNHRIEGVTLNNFQENRHIPIMTDVVPFSEMLKPLGENTVKFAPRGSLIGVSIKNRIDTDIIVTAIIVDKENGVLSHTGRFDWLARNGQKARFLGLSSIIQDLPGEDPEKVFPVYANKDASTVGYTITKDNTTLPCFFIWGFQKPVKVGKPFQLQIRYKTSASATEQTTRVFNIYPPNSKLVAGTKQFDDGYSYNTTITINTANKTGGSNGEDWNNAGTLENDSEPSPVLNAPITISGGGITDGSAGTYTESPTIVFDGSAGGLTQIEISEDAVLRLYDPNNRAAGLTMDLGGWHLTKISATTYTLDPHYAQYPHPAVLVVIPKVYLNGNKVPSDDKMVKIEMQQIA